MKFSKTQISKTIQSGGFLGLLLSKIASPLRSPAAALALKRKYIVLEQERIT